MAKNGVLFTSDNVEHNAGVVQQCGQFYSVMVGLAL